MLPTSYTEAQFVSGQVKNRQSNEALPYIHIGWVNKNLGTISNEKGAFRLSITGIQPGDTLRLSAIGYKPVTWIFPAGGQNDPLNFSLEPEVYDLPTVTSWYTTQSTKLGSHKKPLQTLVWGAGGVPSGEELGCVFELGERERVRLDTFHFNLKYNGKDSLLFRLNLYDWTNEEVGGTLLAQDIRFWINPSDMTSNTDWYDIPLEQYQLDMRSNFLTTIELLRHSVDYGFAPIFLSAVPTEEPAPWRQTAQAKWSVVPDVTFAFHFSVSY